MRTLFTVILGAALLAGCEKAPEPKAPPVVTPRPVVRKPAPPPPAAAANPDVPAAPPVTDKLPTAAGEVTQAPIQLPLTEALHRYLEANGRMPQDFNQLVVTKFIKQVPTPPPGKKFAIDRQRLQVVIVDQ